MARPFHYHTWGPYGGSSHAPLQMGGVSSIGARGALNCFLINITFYSHVIITNFSRNPMLRYHIRYHIEK